MDDEGVVALGDLEVDPAVLEVVGGALAAAVEDVVGSDPVTWVVTQAEALGAPARGWRTVSSKPTRVLPGGDGYVVPADARLAAPHPGERGAWMLARVQAQDGGGWAVWLDDRAHRPGPSRAARGAGLKLRWPDTTVELAAGAVPELTVELVNTTDQPWSGGTGDHVLVNGRVTRGGVDVGGDSSTGWFAYTPMHPVPDLAPGEVIVLPVTSSARTVAALGPGTYEMTAVLLALKLRTPTRALRLS